MTCPVLGAGQQLQEFILDAQLVGLAQQLFGESQGPRPSGRGVTRRRPQWRARRPYLEPLLALESSFPSKNHLISLKLSKTQPRLNQDSTRKSSQKSPSHPNPPTISFSSSAAACASTGACSPALSAKPGIVGSGDTAAACGTPGKVGNSRGARRTSRQISQWLAVIGWFSGDFWVIWIIINGSWRIFGMKMMQKWSILAPQNPIWLSWMILNMR